MTMDAKDTKDTELEQSSQEEVPEASIPIPPQIAVVEGSPSKRVSFSPSKPLVSQSSHGHHFSPTPSSSSSTAPTTPTALRGILKQPSTPTDERNSGLSSASHSANASSRHNDASPLGTLSSRLAKKKFDSAMKKKFVRNAMKALESEDPKVRALTYTSLQKKFRAGDEDQHIQEVQDTIRRFVVCILKDLDVATQSASLVQAALKCLGYYLYNQHIVRMFKKTEMDSILTSVIAVINTTDDKCNERILAVVHRLLHSVPGIRSKALDMILFAIPILNEKEDPRCQQAVASFMNECCEEFLARLSGEFLDVGDEVYAITVWGVLVSLFGKALHRSSHFNPMLKMIEKCFNSSAPTRLEIRMAAFQAWTRLIYSFAIGGHITNEKIFRLVLTPIKNSFSTDRYKRTRLACTNAWIALIYALGQDLPKFASEAFFPMLKTILQDESEHIRDLGLRLVHAIFTNSSGQELVEGSQFIVPGTISFIDLGWSDVDWMRTQLLDAGLEGLFNTLQRQHEITDANHDKWKSSRLTGLPLMTVTSSAIWENMVRAVRNVNMMEKGLNPTPEAVGAVSRLLSFIEKVSQSNPSPFVPGDWPEKDLKQIEILKRNPDAAGYIFRADMVYFLYLGMIDVFSIRTMVAARYKVRDNLHAQLFDALNGSRMKEEGVDGEDEGASPQIEGPKEVSLSPLEFIFKMWLATGESVIGTAFETLFWQSLATLVDMSKRGPRALDSFYKCLDHFDDIRSKRLTDSRGVWSPFDKPTSAESFREFHLKFWTIIGMAFNEINEISDDPSSDDCQGYDDFFTLLLHPFMTLYDPCERKSSRSLINKDHSQWIKESQDEKSEGYKVYFQGQIKTIFLPTLTDLLRTFYKVSQLKRGNANKAMIMLATRVRQCYDDSAPFIWMQYMSVAYATRILETVIVKDSKGSLLTPKATSFGSHTAGLHPATPSDYDELVEFCAFLFEQAYMCMERLPACDEVTDISSVQESVFELVEKTINKAPVPFIMHWVSRFENSLFLWIMDPLHHIQNCPKVINRAYRARITKLWSQCVLPRLLSCGSQSKEGLSRTAFGSVHAPPVPTIRNAVLQQQQGAGSSSERAASPTGSNSDSNSSTASTDSMDLVFNSEHLDQLKLVLLAGLGSENKNIVNETLEFWNQTWGLHGGAGLEYPQEIVAAMKRLKLVATVSLPGWESVETGAIDNDTEGVEGEGEHIEPPIFATLSQEILSLPSGLLVRPALSRLLGKRVARESSDSDTTGVYIGNTRATGSPKKKVRLESASSVSSISSLKNSQSNHGTAAKRTSEKPTDDSNDRDGNNSDNQEITNNDSAEAVETTNGQSGLDEIDDLSPESPTPQPTPLENAVVEQEAAELLDDQSLQLRRGMGNGKRERDQEDAPAPRVSADSSRLPVNRNLMAQFMEVAKSNGIEASDEDDSSADQSTAEVSADELVTNMTPSQPATVSTSLQKHQKKSTPESLEDNAAMSESSPSFEGPSISTTSTRPRKAPRKKSGMSKGSKETTRLNQDPKSEGLGEAQEAREHEPSTSVSDNTNSSSNDSSLSRVEYFTANGEEGGKESSVASPEPREEAALTVVKVEPTEDSVSTADYTKRVTKKARLENRQAFRDAMRQLVESREQLFELQTQLSVLNKELLGAWGQFMSLDDGNDGPSLATPTQEL
ncbi:DNA-binding protein rif1 [Lunasporangiospora selenospora]|uniref:DNA-binding protein rif1 n=1 Tax=Lunasporangiospora selenospora TaxID=979761 RepID=A0A9P6KFX0_9FUNG|nr:DNA-binding protein rif1 [Lunasporangiospora selenospora]